MRPGNHLRFSADDSLQTVIELGVFGMQKIEYILSTVGILSPNLSSLIAEKPPPIANVGASAWRFRRSASTLTTTTLMSCGASILKVYSETRRKISKGVYLHSARSFQDRLHLYMTMSHLELSDFWTWKRYIWIQCKEMNRNKCLVLHLSRQKFI